ncbi:hypothetical protein M089_5369 [Bacteroides ovatus str. 3725 D9 iii]|nr:hypothetical protein M082_5584 [Bacteroides fragilis str. 3725 D9 ii]KDS20674.1 hypothetical protein M089_5369 [Bacteroides ovatus str. 3725 D9 iii]KDS24040.1 hypothetical protein M088_5184 [Bacteroides ovatus str. 3725 D1 iv]
MWSNKVQDGVIGMVINKKRLNIQSLFVYSVYTISHNTISSAIG